MSAKKIKTNASRILDELGVAYTLLTYAVDEDDLSGVHAAEALGLDPACVFKTLVARGDRTGIVVACIPVAAELDLKALARVSGNKSAELLPLKELLPTTGYVRGGCSLRGRARGAVFPEARRSCRGGKQYVRAADLKIGRKFIEFADKSMCVS